MLRTRLEKTNTKICYHTKVTEQYIKDLSPDVVIIATGAEPIIPPIPGIHGDNELLASEAESRGMEALGMDIVILGGGLVGCETAIHLA